MNDLSSLAGFPLQFDPASRLVATAADISLVRATRTARPMRDVLYAPDAVPPELELYHTFHPERLPQSLTDTLAKHQLTFSFVLLHPGQIGGEFVKTFGHYHGCIPGTKIGCPEIYYQLYGRQLLFLQKPDPRDTRSAIECAVVDLSPGMAVEIPPGYLHILINNSDEPTFLVGLYRKDMGHDYEPVRTTRGMAYYILNGLGGWLARANPTYRDVPKLQRLDATSAPALMPPAPVISDFFKYPSIYAFLGEAEAAISRYCQAETVEQFRRRELHV